MRWDKNTLLFFGLLDVISIILISQQIYSLVINYNEIPGERLSQVRAILLLIIYPLLFVSAAGLLRAKKFGLVIYYIQFPLRLLIWIFSFGFLTLLSEYIPQANIFEWIFRIVIILEFFRLYFTVQIHRNYFNTAD